MFYLFQEKYFFENKLDQVRDNLLCGWLKKKNRAKGSYFHLKTVVIIITKTIITST